MPTETPALHIADGWVLAVGRNGLQLIDVRRGEPDELMIEEMAHVDALEAIAMGQMQDVDPALIELGRGRGLIAEGPPRSDPVLRERLHSLDQMFLGHEGGTLGPRARDAYEKTLEAHAWRKRFFTAVGQCPVLPETALRRALLVGDAAEVGQKDVLCIGDDDLVSVALAALGHRVTVFDIDDYLLGFLGSIRDELGLAITFEEVDLLDPLPAAQTARFDVFLTDPMSNRDCFELFLSRAFALLKPGGRGFVAVYPPTARLFRTVAGEMGFAIDRWHRRHNRYYSHFMQLHRYESDWVEVRPTEALVLKPAAGEYCIATNLYREDFFDRPACAFGFYDALEDVHYTKPFFLDLLLDAFEEGGDEAITDRSIAGGADWTLAHMVIPDGHITLVADRARRQMSVEMSPIRPALEDRLRRLILSAYKRGAVTAKVLSGRQSWDVRVT